MAKSTTKTAKTTTKAGTTAEAPKRRTSRRRAVAPEDIAARAYAIFEAEGGGDDVDHWLRAERELHAPARRRR